MRNAALLSWQPRLGRLFIYATLIAVAALYLIPLWVVLLTSFKTSADIRSGNLLSLPDVWVLEGWIKAWGTACTGVSCDGIRGYFVNSTVMVLPAVALSTLLGALNGYVLSLWRFKGSELLFGLLLFGCFIPFQVILLPMAQTLGWLGLANSTAGLVLVHVIYGLCFTTLFYRNFYQALPQEIIKAARLDGAGFFTIFWRIVLPLSGPITMVTLIWQFTAIWNDFLFGVVFSAGDNQPMTVALNNLVNTTAGVKEYNVDMAAAVLAALPTLLVYAVAGKYFVRGLTAGAIKG
ncbi:glucose/mannose transport system permease protein [Atopomonas hussainii]|uniref:Glucose/mannose transport system permease protein n=1 Tax=Atopomonas hussainii TaxID=1429083 RepID=A0A1H7RIG7_9GAMM|nr:carbohydrate ABC transporter permease [Atopomonas hussainii]SEL59983.1 glucose/mannose transport system permease protein [Atopomonas hussainii]